MTVTKTTVIMSYDEYDAFLEETNGIDLVNDEPYWPTEVEIEKEAPLLGVERLVKFIIWQLEHNGSPQNDAEKNSRRAMNNYLHKHLELID